MEGIQKFEGREQESEWKELRENAPHDAERYISQINGFVEMSTPEQIKALTDLIDQLSEDNANRFAAREVSLRLERLREIQRHRMAMHELGAEV